MVDWRRFFRRRTIPGWLITLLPLAYGAIDVWSNIEFAHSKLPYLLQLLLTPVGQLAVTIMGLVILYFSIRGQPPTLEPSPKPVPVVQPPEKPIEVTWRDYKRDEVDGIKWVWKWGYIAPETADNEDVTRFSYSLVPLCPKCDANLSTAGDEVTCPNRHIRKLLNPSYDRSGAYQDYAERIAGEIIRRVRSGEYKEILKQKK